MNNWLSNIGCISKTENEYSLLGRYKILVSGISLTMIDSFDENRIIDSQEIKNLEHFIIFIIEGLGNVKKWN